MSRCQCVSRNHFVQQQIPERNVEQAETDYDKSHYRTAPKGNPQSGIQRTACRIGCTGWCISCRFHPQKTGKAGKETTRQESDRHPSILNVETVGHDWKQNDQPQKHPAYNLVLLFQVRHSAFAHSSGNFYHLGSTFTLLHHLLMEVISKAEG